MNCLVRHNKGSGAPQLLLILAVVITGAVFLYWSWHSGDRKGGQGGAGSFRKGNAPPFILYDTKGEEFLSSSLEGKAVILNFFTTWCPACREEIPSLLDVYEKYKHNGLVVIGISVGDSPEALSSFIAAYGIRYRILIGNIDTVRAFGGFKTVPTTFFISRDWKVKKIM